MIQCKYVKSRLIKGHFWLPYQAGSIYRHIGLMTLACVLNTVNNDVVNSTILLEVIIFCTRDNNS